MSKKYIVFGSGKNGLEVYRHLKNGTIAFFCDNNIKKVGEKIEGIEIISFEKLLEIYKDYIIILSVGDKFHLKRQLERHGISNYIDYQDDFTKNNNIKHNHPDMVMKSDSTMNQLLDTYIKKCEKIDLLNDFYEFKNLVKELKNELNGEYAFYESNYNESMLYGHAKMLMEYAEIKIDYANFPLTVHGSFNAGLHRDYQSAAIFQSPYDKKIHNNRYPYVPIYVTGPHIQYANSIYEPIVLDNLKKKNGKTAVFFITHNAEQSFVTIDEEDILNCIVEVYAKKYSTVYVCAYWCDIDKDIYKRLSDYGVKVISAGFRFDTMFIRRLRTIFELSDDIFVWGFTAPIVYALNLKKNLWVFECNERFTFRNIPTHIPVLRLNDTSEYKIMTDIIFDKMGENQIPLTEKEKDILDLYLGLNTMKTKEEINMIYQISCDIWENCEHLIKDYPIGVYRTYQQYQREYNFEKLTVLSQALGKGFWNL